MRPQLAAHPHTSPEGQRQGRDGGEDGAGHGGRDHGPPRAHGVGGGAGGRGDDQPVRLRRLGGRASRQGGQGACWAATTLRGQRVDTLTSLSAHTAWVVQHQRMGCACFVRRA